MPVTVVISLRNTGAFAIFFRRPAAMVEQFQLKFGPGLLSEKKLKTLLRRVPPFVGPTGSRSSEFSVNLEKCSGI